MEEKKEEEKKEESWFSGTGFEDLDELSSGSSGGSGQRRFWMKEGKETKVIFIDGAPNYKFYEHQVPIDGDFKNWFTCLKDLDPNGCPLCDYAAAHLDKKGKPMYGRYAVGMFNVIDRTEWTDSDGNIHKDEVKILPAKITMLKRFRKRAERYGGSLAGREFIVSRTSKKDANIGDDWEFAGEVDLSKFEYEPFDIKEVCAPKSHADLMKVVKSLGVEEAEVASSPEDDSNIPF